MIATYLTPPKKIWMKSLEDYNMIRQLYVNSHPHTPFVLAQAKFEPYSETV